MLRGIEIMEKYDFVQASENLKSNWYIPISSLAYFYMATLIPEGYKEGLLISFLLNVIIASVVPNLRRKFQKEKVAIRVLAGLSAAGVCIYQQTAYAEAISNTPTNTLKDVMPIGINFLSFGAILAFPFVYVLMAYIFVALNNIFKNIEVFKDIKKWEIGIYISLLAIVISICTFVFMKTDAFYGANEGCNIIYTSDSTFVVKYNAYLSLTHWENDIRQPLFAIFSAPFAGIPYLIVNFFELSSSIYAILVNIVQITLIFISNLLIAKMMQLTPVKRCCFMILSYTMYSQLLFTFMMEQYIIAYFWLVVFLCVFSNGSKVNRLLVFGTGGTLLTSIVTLPLAAQESPLQNFKKWFKNSMRYGLEFILVMLVFCRFDVFYNAINKILFLNKFTGQEVAFTDKIYQYVEFVKNCFLAPNAGINDTFMDYVSWQLNPVREINVIGIIILCLVVISIIINRSKKSSWIAFSWIVFSMIILCGLGWGTQENGLILYALYFGWAFMVLLFQLVEKIEEILKTRFVVPVITIVCTVMLLWMNLSSLKEMIDFAIQYYPLQS